MDKQPLVSCICTTYGRFTAMRRMLTCFDRQDYPNRELIILNTAPVRLSLDRVRRDYVKIWNEPQETVSGKPWTNVGEIRAAALAYASGDIFCLFDDDDIYLPYHISQGVQKLLECGKEAWKPKRSLHSLNDGLTFDYCENTLEASVFAKMDSIREFGFLPETGSENLSWYDGIKNRGGICVDPEGIPSYSYNWGSQIANHKQSGDMRNPCNFENHKRASTDFGQGKLLRPDYPINDMLGRIYARFPECAAKAKVLSL
jgi:glycosyltransferase involved in cell wall biosynthesis